MAYTPPGRTRRKVLEYMRKRLLRGEPPSVREVQRALGFRSVESARRQLGALVAAGALVKLPDQARGYRLPERARPPRAGGGKALLVPLVGRVQAGELALAVEEPEGWLPIETRGGSGELFALRVRGESMAGVGILPGDVVVVRRQRTARSGDVVVALVGAAEPEATVKTLRRRRGRWVLEPANPAFEPIVPDPRHLVILGKVIEVRRYLESLPLVTGEEE